MTTIVSIRLECPVCRTQFQSRSAASGVAIGQDTDFRKHFAGHDPVAYQVHACPQCRFCAFEGDYAQVEEPLREFVLGGGLTSVARPVGRDGELSGSTKYLLAAACYEKDSRATMMRMADLFLRASWCARAENRRQREQQCQREAVLRFEQALDTESEGSDQRPTLLYLLGELYRRIGLYDIAAALFTQALETTEPEPDENLTALLRRQRDAAQAHRSENMTID